MSRVVFASMLLVLTLLPFRAVAGHYDLESAGIADEAVVAKLLALGIDDTRSLWQATATPKLRRDLARKVKVEVSVIAGWRDFCDLLRIDGVGPKIARLMTAAGVANVRALARRKPVELVAKMKSVRSSVPELGKFPDETNLKSWIEQAATLVKADRAAQKSR